MSPVPIRSQSIQMEPEMEGGSSSPFLLMLGEGAALRDAACKLHPLYKHTNGKKLHQLNCTSPAGVKGKKILVGADLVI